MTILTLYILLICFVQTFDKNKNSKAAIKLAALLFTVTNWAIEKIFGLLMLFCDVFGYEETKISSNLVTRLGEMLRRTDQAYKQDTEKFLQAFCFATKSGFMQVASLPLSLAIILFIAVGTGIEQLVYSWELSKAELDKKVEELKAELFPADKP